MFAHTEKISAELQLRPFQIERTLELVAEGGTVPFIARYRKEVTGNLDEVQIQKIIDRADELKQLDDRRAAILKSIEEQGKLTDELRRAIETAQTRTALEDLYLPYKPKRRTRATIARERGLEPLALMIWNEGTKGFALPAGGREELAAGFVDAAREVPDVESAIAGARDICAEWIAENAQFRALARTISLSRAKLRAEVVEEKKEERSKFEQYYAHEEPYGLAPSHRVLAIFRGEAEEFLHARIVLPAEEILTSLRRRLTVERSAAVIFAADLERALLDSWKRLLSASIEAELRTELKERADRQAIEVFGANLRDLLLAAPAGNRRVIALDPGLRTGIKVAMLDETGRLLDTATLYTERSAGEREQARRMFVELHQKHGPELVAVGNGTGSREAEGFVREVTQKLGAEVPVVSVSEQGASIYSASEVARDEFPELDVSLRGAVSIGRRLQDPLGELVKIDPKSIGVGQYQHDVNQFLLKKKLNEVIESCVNAVGVDLNTASAQLLENVSGIGSVLARRIVAHRNERGAFKRRAELLDVRGLGSRVFEQAAGFLRIRGSEPLDNSAVHPERYAVVQQMAADVSADVATLVGNAEAVKRIDWKRYIQWNGDASLGEPTLRDILAELQKPGRDPRGVFEPPRFRDEIRTLDDVKESMVLEGIVTNVTAFGAFVDIGVHQDGLVHVSQLSKKFIREPKEVVKVGDRVTVKVISVDLQRKRMALSMKEV